MTTSLVELAVVAALAASQLPPPGRHFPVGALVPTNRGADQSLSEFCSKHLAAAGEPVLAGRPERPATLRFLYLRTFHHPIVVRVEALPVGARVTGVELEGRGGWPPGKVLRRTSRDIGRDQWQMAVQRLKGSGFWSAEPNLGAPGLDGSIWVLEAMIEGRYHVVDRYSPEDAANLVIRKICEELLGLANLRPPAAELY